MFRKILFAHDGSAASERALLYVENLARATDREVVILHIYNLPTRYAATESYDRLTVQYEATAREVVDDCVDLLLQRGVNARGIVRERRERTAQEILSVAEEEEIKLIVLGKRGPANMAELMLGSVSTEVLRFAQCPVLVVP